MSREKLELRFQTTKINQMEKFTYCHFYQLINLLKEADVIKIYLPRATVIGSAAYTQQQL